MIESDPKKQARGRPRQYADAAARQAAYRARTKAKPRLQPLFDEKTIAAAHEVGHAVVLESLGGRLKYLALESRNRTAWTGVCLVDTMVPDAVADLKFTLAGIVAELLLTGTNKADFLAVAENRLVDEQESRAGNDGHHAFAIAQSLRKTSAGQYNLIKTAIADVRLMLIDRWGDVLEIVKLLVQHDTVSRFDPRIASVLDDC